MLYTGVDGKLTVGGQAACVATFNVETRRAIAEKACLGAEWKEKAGGIKEWTATADGAADFSSAGQKALLTAMIAGAKVACVFQLETGTTLSGDAYIESVNFSHDAEGQAEISVTLAGDGALITTIPTGD